jgi:hypothetical protein
VRAETPIPGFEAENGLERAVTEAPELREGLAWGKPRKSHPEGSVASHVADLLGRLDRSGVTGERRAQLRFITLLHDSFKNQVRHWRPRTGENHHAMRARRFAERFTDDERLLSVIELHDRPYAIWRRMNRTGNLDEDALEAMLSRVPDKELFLAFVELDGSTEGKRGDPLTWFRDELRRRGLLGSDAPAGEWGRPTDRAG